jgi:hypothetical protein
MLSIACRRRAWDGVQAIDTPVDLGHGLEQGQRVRMGGPIENLTHIGVFHDTACVHHSHVVAHLRDNAEVVGNEEEGEV